jgi:hypothetical protein
VAAFHDERAAAAAAAQREAADAARAAEAAAAARGVRDAGRVEFRGERRQDKLASLAELQWLAQRRAAARLEALAAIAASVPYAAALAAATADVFKPTAASAAWCAFRCCVRLLVVSHAPARVPESYFCKLSLALLD